MDFSRSIENDLPKAWKYFEEFLSEEFPEQTDFHVLPFELQLGVYIAFFEVNNADIQLYATSKEALQEAVKEAFETYNEYLFLDS